MFQIHPRIPDCRKYTAAWILKHPAGFLLGFLRSGPCQPGTSRIPLVLRYGQGISGFSAAGTVWLTLLEAALQSGFLNHGRYKPRSISGKALLQKDPAPLTWKAGCPPGQCSICRTLCSESGMFHQARFSLHPDCPQCILTSGLAKKQHLLPHTG